MPLISVIVPIYNVEPYIHKCIDSILSQTFTDFELILVDDGSPDNCGKICDKYAALDSRVVVIHKENGGLSDARNAGIDYALNNKKSDFLLFIDSDDFIKPFLLEKVVSTQENTSADIVCFGIEMVNEELLPLEWGNTKVKKAEAFDYHHRFSPILPPYSIGDYTVNKLYKKNLFNEIRYPVGRTFEDVFTTYSIFNLAKNIYLLPDLLYVYRRRNGSITKKAFNAESFNFFFAETEKYLFVKNNEPLFSRNAAASVANAAILFFPVLISNPKTYESYILKMQNFFNKYWIDFHNNQFCDKATIKQCDRFRKNINKLKRYNKIVQFRRNFTNRKYIILEKLILLKKRIFN